MSKKKITLQEQRAASPADTVIGRRLRARRLEMHMSQGELSEHLGISFQQIQKYEKGVNRISASRLLTVAKVLETSTDFFMADAAKPQTNGDLAFSKFMASKDGVAIIEAMISITKPALRARVIEIARNLAD